MQASRAATAPRRRSRTSTSTRSPRNPKPFVGYSDITALHVAIRQRTGLATFYGYGLVGMGDPETTRVHPRPPARRAERRRDRRGAARSRRPVRARDPPAARRPRRSSAAASGSSCRRWARPGSSSSTARSSSSRTSRRRPTTSTAFLIQLRHAGKLDGVAGVVVGEMKDCDWGDQRQATDFARTRRSRTCSRSTSSRSAYPSSTGSARARQAPRRTPARRSVYARRGPKDAHGRRAGVRRREEGGQMKKRGSVVLRARRSCWSRSRGLRRRRPRARRASGGTLPHRHELAHRLAEPLRRLQPGRLLDLRVHLPDPRPVRRDEPQFAPDFAQVVETSTDGGKTWTFQTHAEREVVGRQAAHGRRRRVDDQHRHQVQGRRRGQRGRPDRAHHARGRARPDDARRPLRAAPSGTCSASSSSSPSCPSTSGGSTSGNKGTDLKTFANNRPGRRRRPLQPHQVPEEPDRALQAQRPALRAEAEGRRVRPADVLERRRDGLGAEVTRDRRDRGRAARPRSRR